MVDGATNGVNDQRLSALNGIATITANDIWTIGNYFDPSSNNNTNQLLFEHWNGINWQVVPMTNDDFRSNFITSLSHLTGNDI